MSTSTASKAVVKINPAFILPKREQITQVSDVSGKNPEYSSLKDHAEWNGFKILVISAEIKAGTIPDQVTGEIKDYCLMVAAIYPPSREPEQSDVRVVATGAGNVFQRVKDAILEKQLPVEGTLRKSGRAWFVD